MKETGVVRRLDELGRIVIPKEIRKRLKIKNGDMVDIYTNDQFIILEKYHPLQADIGPLKAFIEALYGFLDEDTGVRKYKKGILFIGRKNGKSTMDSGLANFMLTKDGEGGAEIYSVATKREQAKVVWDEAKRMIKKSPELNKRIRCLVGGIYYDKTDSFMKALASDSNSLDGLNAHFVIADEVHAWKDKNLLDVMYDSMSAREQPLLIETSTMGTIRESVFDNEYDYCQEVIATYEGLGETIDETILPVIYELDRPEEWLDEECWYKANPRTWNNKKHQGLKG